MNWKRFCGILFVVSFGSAAEQIKDWEVENVGATINSAYHEGWAVMTPDGLTLLFGSNRPGGLSETSAFGKPKLSTNHR
ncbi:hypothetical protein A1OW_18040 [Enterovibrio norvegicus]|uniref:Uncharacterized protein n=1 Tax=Enterovibrio norvegicus DSM 15893 TaxID=1121869 RepID=A0A1I5UF31_9GAMM|nr:hypothetical protein [Enterovibrio norvegicus]OEE52828.1 hypothetical protein A1OS_22475 [Enterovibrio norvegicus]OEF63745.1 hypothetical protein A1OW_18040 [Enterovibrio norvegicus]PMH62704.1 hypothetical protein BCU62_19105 [Enterovibrio norvegicus]PMI34571.1 hypothetical protein BCU47_05900 [Enterovibrio norvegicus]TKF10689.1 hypothetical protein FCV66_19470 [Enterovibrio norvegicus]